MADRFPLIVDATEKKILELPSGDNLNLDGSGIINVASISSTGGATFAGSVDATQFTVNGNPITVDLSGYDTSLQVDSKISTAIDAIPGVDLSNYDTSLQVDSKISTAIDAIPGVDLSNYDTSLQVDSKISTAIDAIPGVDLSNYDTSLQVDSKISTAIDAIPGVDLSNYDTSAEVDQKIADLVGTASSTLDTLGEIASALSDNQSVAVSITAQLDSKANTSALHTIALTGSYSDLDNKPSLFDGNYNSLSNKPSLFDGSYNSLSDRPSLFDGNYNSLSNKPSLFDGSYNSLSDRPSLFDGNYNSLSNRPSLFDGNYNSLSNTPDIVSVLENLSRAVSINIAGSAISAGTLDVSTGYSSQNYKVPFLDYIGGSSGTFGFLHDSVSSQFTYNPSTNTLTASTFNGNATSASTVNFVIDGSNSTRYIPFVNSTSPGNRTPGLDTALTYNPGINTMGLGRLQLLQTGNPTSSQLYMGGATSNRILFNSNGVDLPTTNSRSEGTKITLFPSLSSTMLDYGMGVASNTFWFSIPSADSTHEFRWYGADGSTSREMMTLGYDSVDIFLNDTGSSTTGRFNISSDGSNSGGRFVGGDGTEGNYGTIKIGSGRGSSVTNFTSSLTTNIICSQSNGSTMIGSADGIFDVLSGAAGRGGVHIMAGGQTEWGLNSGAGTMCKMVRRESGKIFSFLEGSTERGSISVDFSNNTTQFNTTSDYRIKENITPIENALEKVNQLKPVNFNFIGKNQKLDGFIAHEVQDVLPYAVTGEKDATEIKAVFNNPDNIPENDGSYESEQAIENADKHEEEVPVLQQLDNSKLVAMLTAAIQELSAENEALKARLDVAGL